MNVAGVQVVVVVVAGVVVVVAGVVVVVSSQCSCTCWLY